MTGSVPQERHGTKEPVMTRFLLLTKQGAHDLEVGPMTEWDQDDITAHLDYLRKLNQELIENGELVDLQVLTAPELAKIVTFDGHRPFAATDGPYREVLAGYQLVDVESEARAIEIAAAVSAAPGPGGIPIRNRIEVRQLMGSPSVGDL
jgi:hypothetical protein